MERNVVLIGDWVQSCDCGMLLKIPKGLIHLSLTVYIEMSEIVVVIEIQKTILASSCT